MRGTRSLSVLRRASNASTVVRQRQLQPAPLAVHCNTTASRNHLLQQQPFSTQQSSPEVFVSQHRHAKDDSAAAPSVLNNPEHSDATKLVDDLLLHTRALMDAPWRQDIVSSTNDETHVRHVVAFSGGIDSSLVLALLVEASSRQQQQSNESVHAVIGRSPAVPQDQLALAQQVANHIGISLEEVITSEGTDETYIANNGKACLACKTHLYSALEAVAEHAASGSSEQTHNHHHHHHHQLYNGTNADDVQDSTRVGLIAARNFHVQSPLIYTTKQDVRRAAKHLGLPNWNVAASPCLRSRLALGVAATQDHLQRIEAAESFVRQQLKGVISETSNLRVRLLAGNRAMLEIDEELLPYVEPFLSGENGQSFQQNRNERGTSWESHFVQTLGFSSFGARAFRSGSVSVATPPGTSTGGKSHDVTNDQETTTTNDKGVGRSMDGLREAVAY